MALAARIAYLWAFGAVLMAPALMPRAFAQDPAAPPAAPAVASAGEADDVVMVEAEGEGLDKDGAIKAALRDALEKGGKAEIFSESAVENFQLVHDTIISRAEGIVTDYQIVKGPTPVMGGGTVKVWIKARVSKKAMVDSWGAIQNLLNQIGRPKIMVYIVEKIDGQPEQQSILETKIEERMLKSGFDLVDRNQTNVIAEKEKADAAAEGDVTRLQAIAKDLGAHILITGTANANQAGMENLYGTPVAFYNCDAQVKVFWTDTAKLLASVGLPQTRGGARGRKEFSPQAGKQALDFAGQRVVNEIYQQVMSQWATALSAGGELILEVEGLKAPAAIRLKKMLSAIEGVEKINYDMTKGLVKFRINARMGGQDLFERLAEGEFEKAIELIDLKANRIQAKAAEGTK